MRQQRHDERVVAHEFLEEGWRRRRAVRRFFFSARSLDEPGVEAASEANVDSEEPRLAALEAAIAKKDSSAPSMAVDPRAASAPVPADPHVTDLENRIRERVGLRIGLHYKAGKGRLEIQFHSDGELDRILDVLGVSVD